MGRLVIVPVSRERANRYIAEHHSHHGPVRADIIRAGLESGGGIGRRGRRGSAERKGIGPAGSH